MAKKKAAKKKATKKATKKTKKSPVKKAVAKKSGKKKGAKKKAKRTTMYSSKGKKLYAVRSAGGQFKDIQTYKRAHTQDMKRHSKAEAEAQPAAPVVHEAPAATPENNGQPA